MSPVSKAKIKANAKYTLKAYDRIELTVKKGHKAELRRHAESQGESLNGFVNRAIIETVSRDGGIAIDERIERLQAPDASTASQAATEPSEQATEPNKPLETAKSQAKTIEQAKTPDKPSTPSQAPGTDKATDKQEQTAKRKPSSSPMLLPKPGWNK